MIDWSIVAWGVAGVALGGVLGGITARIIAARQQRHHRVLPPHLVLPALPASETRLHGNHPFMPMTLFTIDKVPAGCSVFGEARDGQFRFRAKREDGGMSEWSGFFPADPDLLPVHLTWAAFEWGDNPTAGS